MMRVGEASPAEQEKARIRQEVFNQIKKESARQCEEGDVKAAMGSSSNHKGGMNIQGHRRISQETFDEAVAENIEDLEMVYIPFIYMGYNASVHVSVFFVSVFIYSVRFSEDDG